ncbi:MAG TPA: thioredoxin domain-containing protein [Nitrospira sp.]|nr:thioredoxin domain-containing protein [Nitrospira sp.]
MTQCSINRLVWGVGMVAVAAAIFPSLSLFHPHPNPSPNEHESIIAQVGSRSITLREVEKMIALQLYQLDEQRTNLLRQALERLIDEELLRAEASRRGLTVSELVTAASETEEVARLANLPGPTRRSAGTGDSSRRTGDREEQARIRQALLVALRRKADIRLDLPGPSKPIMSVPVDGAPWAGSASASVTIVEFSDFECPYCKSTVPVLQEVLQRFAGKVKLVYRHFPGPNHPHAWQAAEAAQCAAEQGRFWDYHEELFNRQRTGTGWDFLKLAGGLKLDQARFQDCVEAGRSRDRVAKDLDDGLRLGVTSTPTYFINGRPLIGARPVDEFSSMIETLLQEAS